LAVSFTCNVQKSSIGVMLKTVLVDLAGLAYTKAQKRREDQQNDWLDKHCK